MNIAIIGGRDFNDFETLEKVVLTHVKGSQLFDCKIISGKAKGADTLGEKFAEKYGLEVIEFPADWAKFGKSAGIIRNKDIIKNGDVIFAFWDRKSKGTANGIELCKKQDKRLILTYYGENEIK